MRAFRNFWWWIVDETGHPLVAILLLAVLFAAGPVMFYVGMSKAFDSSAFSAAVNRKVGRGGENMQRQELLNQASKAQHETDD